MGLHARSANRRTQLAVAGLTATLLVGLLMLVAPNQPAAAQQAIDQVCVTGVYVDGTCEVRTDQAPDCEPGTCAITVERPSRCLEADECPVVTPAPQRPLRCPDGALGVPDFCYIYLAVGPDGCSYGANFLPDGNCAQPVASRPGWHFCEDGASLVGRDCIVAGEPVYGFCPGSSSPVDGSCIDFAIDGLTANCGLLNEDFTTLRCIEPTEQVLPSNASTCQADAQFFEGACVVPAFPIIRSCGLIEEPGDWSGTGSQCESRAKPTEVICPAGFSQDSSQSGLGQWDSGGCFRFEPTTRCAQGELAPDGRRCGVVAGFGPGTAVCPDGFDPDIERFRFPSAACERTERAEQGGPRCPTGALEDADGCYVQVMFGPESALACLDGTLVGNIVCTIEGDPPVHTPGLCPVSDTVFLYDQFCYTVVSRPISSTGEVGGCPAGSTEVDGECRKPVAIAPGPLDCIDPDFSVTNDGSCVRWAAPLVPPTTCPDAAEQIVDGRATCRQDLQRVAGEYSCTDPAAELTRDTCVYTTPLTRQLETSDYICTSGTFIDPEGTDFAVGIGNSQPLCQFDDPAADLYCLAGRLDRGVCLFKEPFEVLTCPAFYTSINGWPYCQRFVPRQDQYLCDVTIGIDAGGFPLCATPEGPQPGDCPGLMRDEQCYKFVPHLLTCAPDGCVWSVPAVPAAPVADRGDVDCDGQLILLDAFLLARSIAESNLGRETTCAGVAASGGIRITAADIAKDGTVNRDDARRLLQCIVDDNLANCAG